MLDYLPREILEDQNEGHFGQWFADVPKFHSSSNALHKLPGRSLTQGIPGLVAGHSRGWMFFLAPEGDMLLSHWSIHHLGNPLGLCLIFSLALKQIVGGGDSLAFHTCKETC